MRVDGVAEMRSPRETVALALSLDLRVGIGNGGTTVIRAMDWIVRAGIDTEKKTGIEVKDEGKFVHQGHCVHSQNPGDMVLWSRGY